ncbi:DNA translocase FtsK [Fusicatenibacter saccharivorans]|uniref:DNA translocase FtsK n=1 Tax=Fusicatenibacter saccharivorans TaxID=1150298 RepID=A0A174G7H6_9FIRM|nr:FtsK/SpoIIIE domain-containing protein [Fusicatenibacter saccharivorans]CUO57597.1 DNA translocase FtsK [Fusicatenibacter saccharivorans]
MNRRIFAGIEEIKRKKWKIVFLIAYWFIVCLEWIIGIEKITQLNVSVYNGIFQLLMLELLIIGTMLILIRWGGNNRECKKIEKVLEESKFIDKKGNPPLVLRKEKEMYGYKFCFYSEQIPLAEFEKQKAMLEVLLNIKIVSIEWGYSVRDVIIKGIPRGGELNKVLTWEDTMIDEREFVLRLGRGYFEEMEWNIAEIPHCLLGGGSGSGKTILLKGMLRQAIIKGATVIVGDFKGGVDYSASEWKEGAVIITEEEVFLEKLEEIVKIMRKRQENLRRMEVSKIEDYNEKTDAKMKRIIICIDEFTQILNKKDKERKILHSKIENCLIYLTAQGRCVGIHAILCTQRPDCEVLDGKIKANLGLRICGRADAILSDIIIDSKEAAELISQKDVGFFVTNFSSNRLFKAYYFEDKKMGETNATNKIE